MPTLTSLLELSSDEQRNRGLQFTPQEIAQQPETWRQTFQLFNLHHERIAAFLDGTGLRQPLTERPTVVLIGAGTSDYIGHALVLLLRQAWGCEVIALASTDLLLNAEEWLIPGRRYLWISFSRSGNSPEGVAVLEHAIRLYPEIAHLVITCNAEAKMIGVAERAQSACAVVLNDAVNDRSLAMTSSFTNMVIMGQCLAHIWSVEEYSRLLEDLVQAGSRMLVSAAEIADRIAASGVQRACFVGSGALASVARESALKLLEMTAGQVATMSETVLGLRHGPMAALNSDTLFVCFASGESRRSQYARDLLREIGEKHVASQRVVLAPAEVRDSFAGCAEQFLSINGDVAGAMTIPDVYRPPLDVIFGQMLGLLCSVTRGLHPDAPSPGGVIHRVVQPFQIY